ncbi:hypothetical protein DFJ73DRAFT_962854 [Zopfochytrium polystomum]|nr:hypothetical protein DFJ73DRAFT_962854 [Zopfochytrium polystomum]
MALSAPHKATSGAGGALADWLPATRRPLPEPRRSQDPPPRLPRLERRRRPDVDDQLLFAADSAVVSLTVDPFDQLRRRSTFFSARADADDDADADFIDIKVASANPTLSLDVDWLHRLAALRHLTLVSVAVSDAFLSTLLPALPNLERLAILADRSDTQISPHALAAGIRALPRLRALALACDWSSSPAAGPDTGTAEPGTSPPPPVEDLSFFGVDYFSVGGTDTLEADALRAIAASCPRVRSLTVGRLPRYGSFGNPAAGAALMRAAAECFRGSLVDLRVLRMNAIWLTDDHWFPALIRDNRHLRRVRIVGPYPDTVTATTILPLLAEMRELRLLHIQGMPPAEAAAVRSAIQEMEDVQLELVV